MCIERTYGGADGLEHRDHVRRVLWYATTLACHYERALQVNLSVYVQRSAATHQDIPSRWRRTVSKR